MIYTLLEFMMKGEAFEALPPQSRFNFIIVSMELVEYSCPVN